MAQEVKKPEAPETPEPKPEERFWMAAADMRKEFERLFGSLAQTAAWLPRKAEMLNLRPAWNWIGFQPSFSPMVDLVEKPEAYVVIAELPGIEAKDISLDLSGDVLTITGEKVQDTEHSDANFHFQERHYGAFQRAVTVPSSVNSDAIVASFDKGTLTVTLPKLTAGTVAPKKIAISTP